MVSTPAVVPQPQETEAIAGLVEKYLRPHQANDYRIIVRREAIRLGARRWLVEVDVEANGGEVRADDVADRIVAVNQDLDRDFPRYIRVTQLVPTRDELM